jgi:arylsulfatase A-like enzyme
MREAGYYAANIVNLPQELGFKGTGKTDWNFTYAGKPFDTARWSDLKSHQPFFAQINFHETHRKFNGEKRADPAKVEIPLYEPDHPVARRDRAEYLDAASELDRKIGLILKLLSADGLLDNTILVFFGDNGESSIRGKQFCYEEGLRVPMIIQWPKGIRAPAHYGTGLVDDRLLMAIDLAPTMLAMAGAKIPVRMEGEVFLGEQAAKPRSYVFGARDRCDMTIMRLRTVRDARYRYIRNFTPYTPFLARNEYKEKSYPVWNLVKELNNTGKLTSIQAVLCQPTMPAEELYDLDEDPQQVHNLALSADHKAIMERLREALNDWIKKTGDQGQRLETLDEVQKAEPRFVKELDWRIPK